MAPPITPWQERIRKFFQPGPDDECWIWTGGLDKDGYGKTKVGDGAAGRRDGRAHRVVYELMVGPIPEGLTLDHLCRVRSCVNPNHLEPIPNIENIRRGEGLAAQNARKTHCPRGHEYTESNIYRRPNKPNERNCRICRSVA